MSYSYKRYLLVIFSLFIFAFCNGQSTSFTYKTANGLYCTPVSVSFTQTSSGSPSGYSWNFGNGKISNIANPSVIYTKPGTYTVTLIAIYANNTAQSSQSITINPAISVALTADRTAICAQGDINFVATPAGDVSSYTFDFGDGSPAITTTGNTAVHNFSAFGNFTVRVTATSPFGCTATSTVAVQVQKTILSGTVSPVLGCVPATANFNTSYVGAGLTITNYDWDFGDGSTFSGNTPGTSHTYTVAGNYAPKVTITTNEGCSNSFSFSEVHYGKPPTNVQASVVKPVICGSEMAEFDVYATDADQYVWTYGDNTGDSTQDTHTKHKYTKLGIKTVTVTPFYNRCPGPTQVLTVEVIGVIAGFAFKNTCTARNIYAFTDASIGNIDTYSWNFGDGSPLVLTKNPVHTYPLSGTFPTSLIIRDNITGCQDTTAVNIYTAQPVLIHDSAICRYNKTTFTINNNYENPNNIYTWNTLGQVKKDSSAPHTITANIFGLYSQNSVIINYGMESCPDTIRLKHSVLVRGPIIDFSFATPVCANSIVKLLNKSAPYISTDTIKVWNWNYGDSLSLVNDTSFQSQTLVYNTAGFYKIRLDGIDKNGCKDSLIKPIQILLSPYLIVVPQRDTICQGKKILLEAFHIEPFTWLNSSSLSCATCDSAYATPPKSINYVASVTNNLGCTTTDTSRILVYEPFTASVSSADVFLCAGDSVQISASPPGKMIKWSPAFSISNPKIYDPVIFPVINTAYTAYITDTVGCFTSSATVNAHINTKATVKAGPDILLPYGGTAQLLPVYTGNITNYLWMPGTNLSCSDCASPLVTALSTQQYLIKVTTDSGCVARDSLRVIVKCNNANLYLPNAFTPNSDGRNEYFYPLTRGVSIIIRFSVFDRFGHIVFSRANFLPNIQSLGWDGKIDNLPQELGTYVYMIEALCDQGEKLEKKGTVVLVR